MTSMSSKDSVHQLTGEAKISARFKDIRRTGRKGALIGFLAAGDPSLKDSLNLCRSLIRGGVDILELGVPFSDPLADGPTIQAADMRALKSGTTILDCVELARDLSKETDVPVVLLTYYNPIYALGLERFMSLASGSVSGLVVPDLPSIESGEFSNYKKLASDHGLATILLAAPTTTESRLRLIMKQTSGFLYLVSLLGVTGARKQVSTFNLSFIERVSRLAGKQSIPVAVGFGVSEADHVRTILKSGASGVIVGSALVNIVARNLDNVNSASLQLEQLTRELSEATR
jgi:tryptophan synthase alpha chain